MSTWDDVQVAIRSNLDKPMTIGLVRDGQPVTVQAEPMVTGLPVYDDQGRPQTDDVARSSPSERASSATMP